MDELFSELIWYRLSALLLNIRKSAVTTAHPVSVIQAITKGVSATIEKNMPTIFHIKDKRHTFKMNQFDKIPLEIFFFDREGILEWKDRFISYLSHPEHGKNFELLEIGEVEERSYNMLTAEIGLIDQEGELCLEFLTPLPFRPEIGKPRTYISKSNFIKAFEKRFSRLFGRNFIYKSNDDSFSLLPYYWRYTEIKHPSQSQIGTTQYINGCVGKLYIKGIFKDLLPFLILGRELHTGNKLSNSQGYYLLHKDSVGYFENLFPNKKAILSVTRDVIEKYDNAIESLSKKEGFLFKPEEYAEKLFHQITQDTYNPLPNTAFIIKKKGVRQRLVEQLNFNNLIVQQYLLKTITPIFDQAFEESSIGFRKGLSREGAIDIIQSAIADGYQYVIESDIEDFFPSIDIGILADLLDFYLPKKDIRLKNLLLSSIKNGYILDGRFYLRVKGLAQGSPLSPILANLYLDSFDEKIKELGVRMVRYADDFIIFTSSKEEAEEIFSEASFILNEIGLKLKQEKTALKHVKDGFLFLGIRFTGQDVKIEPEEILKQLKKPLYLTEPYLFLFLNGDAIDIRQQKSLIETIPLRRISEIIVMEKAVFSTALLKRCIENNIPLTITLNSGYYITTIKPDSKKYYDISSLHAQKYFSLSEAENFYLAKEFALGKIKNYIPLFRQRYRTGLNIFIRELEAVIQKIHQAGDINQVRGLEGAIAKKIYSQLNNFIENENFHIKKRDRHNPDRINSLLNFGYYLLFSRINATVRAIGLNPYLGFLHSLSDNYESFVCDIEELFRARIVRFIIRLVNLKIITQEDFVETEKGTYLKKEAVKRFISQFEKEMIQKSSNTLSLKESIYLQVDIFKRWILEDAPLWFYSWQEMKGNKG